MARAKKIVELPVEKNVDKDVEVHKPKRSLAARVYLRKKRARLAKKLSNGK